MSSLKPASNLSVLQLSDDGSFLRDRTRLIAVTEAVESLGGRSILAGKVGRSAASLIRAGARFHNEPRAAIRRIGSTKILRGIIQEFAVNLIVTHDEASTAYAQLYFQNLPNVFFCNETLSSQKLSFFPRPRINSSKVHHFVTPIDSLKDYLMIKKGQNQRRITTIRTAINPEATNLEAISSARTSSIARNWSVTETAADLIIIPADNHNPFWQTRLLALIDDTLAQGGEDIKFVIVEDQHAPLTEKKRTALLNTMKRAPYSSFLRFGGYITDIEAAVKLASVVVYLTADELANFPIATVAQAMGRGVVLPKVESAFEYIPDRQEGQRAIDDTAEIATFLLDILTNFDRTYSSRLMIGRNFIRQFYDTRHTTRQFHELFESLSEGL